MLTVYDASSLNRRSIQGHRPGPAFTASLSVFPALNVGDVDADIETASPVLGLRPVAGRPASGAEGRESWEPYLLTIGKGLADGREHTAHRVPCSTLAQGPSGPPGDQRSLHCSSIHLPLGRCVVAIAVESVRM